MGTTTRLQNEIAALQGALATRNKTIAELNAKLSQAEKTIAERDAKIEALLTPPEQAAA